MDYKYYKDFDEHVYSKKLDNGLKVVLIPKKNFQQTFAMFTTNYGASDISFIPFDKNQKVNQPAGIAHFLEHKLFSNPDGTDAFEQFSKLGVSSNAFTSYDRTSYLFSGTDNINEALNLLIDFVQTPYFTKQNILKEQGIIEEEINMYIDSPSSRLSYMLNQNTYKNHPIRNEILGDVKSIKKITKNSLYTAYNTFYHPSNMFLTVVGNFNVDEIMKIIVDNQKQKDFNFREPVKRIYPFEPTKVNEKYGSEEFNTVMPYAGVSVKFQPIKNSRENAKSSMVMQILFEYYFSNSGVIYNELLKKNLINNSFDYYLTNNENLSNCNLISYSNNPKEFINVVENSLINLKRRKIDKDRFNTIKRSFYGAFIKSLNNISGYSYNLLGVIPYDLDLFVTLDLINEIEISDLEALAKQIKNQYISSYYLKPIVNNNNFTEE